MVEKMTRHCYNSGSHWVCDFYLERALVRFFFLT